jgi:hypothetical protein
MGVGTIAARPATCTVGVGYWATDEQKFYKCNSTNVWTLHYQPLTYPHPLVTGEPEDEGEVFSSGGASVNFVGASIFSGAEGEAIISFSGKTTANFVSASVFEAVTIEAECEIESLDINGFTLDWTEVDATPREVGWLALGGLPELNLNILLVENISIIDSTVIDLGGAPSALTENITVTDFVQLNLSAPAGISVDEDITVTDFVQFRTSPLIIRLSETLSVTDHFNPTPFGPNLVERIFVTDHVFFSSNKVTINVFENISVTESPMNGIGNEVPGSIGIGPNPTPISFNTGDYWTDGI